MSSLPYDVISTIIAFATTDAYHALQLGLVNHTWYQGFAGCEVLIGQHAARLWYGGGSSQFPGLSSLELMQSRAAAVTPLVGGNLKLSELHPIENCDFLFRCPQFAESLRPTSKVASIGGLPMLYCDVCEKHVTVVSSQGELQQCAAERKCVMIRESDGVHTYRGVNLTVLLCVTEPSVASQVLAAVRAATKAPGKQYTTTVTFEGMIVESSSTKQQIVFLIEVVPPRPKKLSKREIDEYDELMPPSGIRFGSSPMKPVPSYVYFQDSVEVIPTFVRKLPHFNKFVQDDVWFEKHKFNACDKTPGTFARETLLPLIDNTLVSRAFGYVMPTNSMGADELQKMLQEVATLLPTKEAASAWGNPAPE